MNILVLNGSPRKDGNTDLLTQAFSEGARESGNTVHTVMLQEQKINPCMACDYCRNHNGTCIQQDGMTDIYELAEQADMIVFASPIYYFTISAQLKIAIDRFYAKGKTGYHLTKAALMLVSASPDVYTSAIAQYKDMLSYMNWEDKGIFTADGMNGKGAVKESSLFQEIRAFGKSLS